MELIYFTKFLKGLTVKQIGETAKRMGFDGLDLAVRSGQAVNPDNVATALPEAMKVWTDMGVSVPLVSMETRTTDPRNASTQRLYEACAKAKIKFIKIGYWRWRTGQDYWPGVEKVRDDVKDFEKISRELGITTVIHTHSGDYYGCNASSAMTLVKDRDPKYVGLYLDPAHLFVAGEPLELALAIAKDYLSLIACKNCTYVQKESKGPAAEWERNWCLVFDGLVNWPEAVGLLKKIGYDGPISIHGEYTGPQEREFILPRVEKDAAFIRKYVK